ncbi:LysM peptidoglycan-binding domain-containing protein [Alkalihalobacillus sp. MEB130]|uniref:LysM peptidoglycan-binding domain-containing protein n=1 Tax=Alkalihalobacillus sp. MEB130 TaxID=2976704 RepID=UPI0028DE5102|nr:LysM peptidoglycan-binding domain-containing protein [Alkalihalobacillus sp. MEB130]MDT8861233.1 LysM peptidoglycan-binding domain-containing protein [Alkalihalobacillus sp. MEB130]
MKIYVTYEGESLYDVAKHCNVQVDVLQSLNKHIKNPSYIKGNTHITVPSVMGINGIIKDDQLQKTKGNVCAYVQDEPVKYKKVKITHWPSQDYSHPHPKNGTHASEMFDDQQPVHHHTPQQYAPQHPPSYYMPQQYKQSKHKQRGSGKYYN